MKNRARCSNKKGMRRRNVELGREMQRQWEGAAAMGFGSQVGDEGIVDSDDDSDDYNT